jgi:simple sugar transport system permease protein
MSTTSYTEREIGSRSRDYFAANAQVLSIAGFLIGCCAVFSLGSSTFLTAGNALNVLRQLAPILVVAIAMTFVITTGGIDLSVGSMAALTNALVAILIHHGVPWPAAVVAILALGGAIGWLQGWISASQAIPSFIVTLATMSTLRGIALYSTKGFSVPIESGTGFDFIGTGTLFGIPVPALIAVIVSAVGYVYLNRGRYGRRVVAVGSNAEAARRAGMPTLRIKTSVFLLTGLASAAAGLILASRLGSGSSNAGAGFELDVIAAVVLGGTSLMGGRATITGTILGSLTIAVIGNGLILMHISPFFTQIITGLIILGAIWLNTRVFGRYKSAKK